MEEHFLLKLLLLEQLVLKLIGFHIAKYSLTGKGEYLTSGHISGAYCAILGLLI